MIDTGEGSSRGTQPATAPALLKIARSIPDLLQRATLRWGPSIAMRHRKHLDRWGILTFSEVAHQTAETAAGLADLGLQRGDRVAVFSATRVEWTICDYAILTSGAVTVPVYHTCTAGQLTYQLNSCQPRVLIVDNEARLKQVLEVRDRLRSLEAVIVLDRFDIRHLDGVTSLVDLQRTGRRYLRQHPDLAERSVDRIGPDDVATIVYTSGVSGLPRGVVLTHRNLLAAVQGIAGALPVDNTDVTVSFLPLSHIFGRIGQFLALEAGVSTAYAQRIDRLEEVLLEVKPTFIFGVPRVYERIYRSMVGSIRELSPLRRKLFDGAKNGMLERYRDGGAEAGAAKRSMVERAAEKVVLERIREGFGGRMRFVVSGGAPLHPSIAELFHVVGVEVLEGYGLTETAAAATVSRLEDNMAGSVGRPIPGIRIRISPDGEVLARGDSVFREYHGMPEETAAVFDDRGWFHTGDTGRIDSDGRLIITGRIKDLLITSGAKNIAPQYVEGALKTSPLIAEALVYGDRRPYVVALLDLRPKAVADLARELGLDPEDYGALIENPRVQVKVAHEVELANSRLARFEQVRQFAILPEHLEIGGGLTHSHKLRREQVERRYRRLIDGLYS